MYKEHLYMRKITEKFLCRASRLDLAGYNFIFCDFRPNKFKRTKSITLNWLG